MVNVDSTFQQSMSVHACTASWETCHPCYRPLAGSQHSFWERNCLKDQRQQFRLLKSKVGWFKVQMELKICLSKMWSLDVLVLNIQKRHAFLSCFANVYAGLMEFSEIGQNYIIITCISIDLQGFAKIIYNHLHHYLQICIH